MKKNVAVELLNRQKDLLKEQNLEMNAWIKKNAEVLLKVFPVSGSAKLTYFDLGEMPDFFQGYPEKTKIEFFRNMAVTHLHSFVKEIEARGLEEHTTEVAV